MIQFYITFICESDTNSRVWNRRVAYIFITLFLTIFITFFVFKLLSAQELKRIAWYSIIFWKLLSDLSARVLLSLANDRFSITAISFWSKVDSFNLEYQVNFASFPFHYERCIELEYQVLDGMHHLKWKQLNNYLALNFQ